MRKFCFIIISILLCSFGYAAEKIVTFKRGDTAFPLISNGSVTNILYDSGDQRGIGIAVNNLIEDFNRVCGVKPKLLSEVTDKNCIIIGSIESIKNPRSGIITVDSVNDVITGDEVIPCKGKVVIR